MASLTLATAIVLQVMLLAAAAPQVDASGADLQARAHYAEGARHYQSGDAARALEAFRAAYALAPHAELLFNIAQCHRQLGDGAKALESYEAYLRARPDAPNRAEVERWMNDLRPPRRPAAPGPRDTTESLAPLAPTMIAPAAVEQRSEVATTPLHRKTWFWIAAGVLVASAALGLTYVLLSPSEPNPSCKDPACIKPL